MSKSLTLATAFVIAASISAGSVTYSTPALAYACKTSPYQAVGVRKTRIAAQVVARKGWSARVKDTYGLQWSVLKIAKNKVKSCAKISTSQGPQWRCLLSAKPCKYVVQ